MEPNATWRCLCAKLIFRGIPPSVGQKIRNNWFIGIEGTKSRRERREGKEKKDPGKGCEKKKIKKGELQVEGSHARVGGGLRAVGYMNFRV